MLGLLRELTGLDYELFDTVKTVVVDHGSLRTEQYDVPAGILLASILRNGLLAEFLVK